MSPNLRSPNLRSPKIEVDGPTGAVTPLRQARSMTTSADPDRDTLLFVARAIALRGVALIHVGSAQCSEPGCCGGAPEPVPWTYTIGLVEHGHPEVVTLGLPMHHAAPLLNWVHDRHIAGSTIEPGDIEEFDGVPVQLAPVPTSWVCGHDDPMGRWFAHYAPGRPSLDPPEVRQVLWADRTGLLPWDRGCDPEVVALQPILGHGDELPLNREPLRRPRGRRRR